MVVGFMCRLLFTKVARLLLLLVNPVSFYAFWKIITLLWKIYFSSLMYKKYFYVKKITKLQLQSAYIWKEIVKFPLKLIVNHSNLSLEAHNIIPSSVILCLFYWYYICRPTCPIKTCVDRREYEKRND